ncbi:MAG: relaxase/mobilization nuclease domain-containing protein [Eubacteriales bacterium]|nr:relaxase/mobilization nuclease domain-containing protein [Eubacteriales bacterium]
MAVTEIKPIHFTTGKALKYVMNPSKTDESLYVFSHKCSTDYRIADIQMKVHRMRFGKDSKNLLHHGMVSFVKGEITAEAAYVFAQKYMQEYFNSYQYCGAVHVDKEHIHFHFLINAVDENGKKYNSCKRSLSELRAWTDTCCERDSLSVVIPKGKGKSYKKWMDERTESEAWSKDTWTKKIKNDIDAAIEDAGDWEHFLKILKEKGYFIKHGEKVMHILFRPPGMKAGRRGHQIGDAYTEQAIKDRIRFKEYHFSPVRMRRPKRNFSPIEKELFSLKHRRTTVSTVVALGIHMLAGSKMKVLPKYPRLKNRYDKRIRDLALMLRFVQTKGITSREQIEQRIAELQTQQQIRKASLKKLDLLENPEEVREVKVLLKDLEKNLREHIKLIEALDQIKDRTLASNLERGESTNTKTK